MKHTKRCRGHIVRSKPLPVTTHIVRLMLWSECATCGAWLPLGPSDETRVAVEVRAAAIAAGAVSETDWRTAHPYEWYGWLEHKNGTEAGIDGDEYQTGYLARVIWVHDREQAAEFRKALNAAADTFLDGISEQTP